MLTVQFYDKASIVQRALAKRQEAAPRVEKLRANQQVLLGLTADGKAYLAPFINKGKAMQRFQGRSKLPETSLPTASSFAGQRASIS